MADHKVCILANPEGNAWEYAEEIFNYLNKKDDCYELNRVIIESFRNGEIKPKIEDNIRDRKCFFIHDSTLDSNK
jgi:phosphoribosylpyrophosphate synthetase